MNTKVAEAVGTTIEELQDVIEFEGQEISSLSVYPFGSGKPNSLLCDPSDPDNFSNLAAGPGSDGALIIRW